MTILIVSKNALFREVIRAILGGQRNDLVELNHEEALEQLDELQPAVTILDEYIPRPWLTILLEKMRSLKQTRIVMLNLQQNDIVLLDCQRTTLNQVDDLLEVISGDAPRLSAVRIHR